MSTLKQRIDNLNTKTREINSIVKIHRNMVADCDIFIDKTKTHLKFVQQAATLIRNAAQETQAVLEKHISGTVTLALQSVFPNPPKFVMRMIVRRNQVECDLLFEENNQSYKPISGAGGGTLDIVAFALRIAFWSLVNMKEGVRSTIILDEPFKNVSPDLQSSVSTMVSELSKRLNLQIIMVSHAEDINTAANKTFQVSKNKLESKIQVC